jgi:hypothetical protein
VGDFEFDGFFFEFINGLFGLRGDIEDILLILEININKLIIK